MAKQRWSESDIVDQTGRTALVTGSNTGLGLDTARALAEHGARVVLACRNQTKGEAAAMRIRSTAPNADVVVVPLDLADLASVRAMATAVLADESRLDLLINNAGVMALPRQETADGFEMQFGTNHLGHFALTMLLLPRLIATPGSRVVTVSSMGHRMGRMNFDDLQGTKSYHRWLQYGMTKLSNLLFTYELQRRLQAAVAPTIAVAAHPGGSNTELARDAGTLMRLGQPMANLVMQSAAMGALPSLRAATDPSVIGGEYYGPDGLGETRGHPVRVSSSRASHDVAAAARLWSISEELTGTTSPL
jgi:NAD(P)-dependent dehydrogenase (short-subunit alcohol dehydrogenase family)